MVEDISFKLDQKEGMPSLIYNEIICNQDNHAKVEEILRDNRYELNNVDHAGRTLMSLIVQIPCPPDLRAFLIRKALEHGADPFQNVNRMNEDCIAMAIIQSREIESIRALSGFIPHGRALDGHGNTFLHLIVEYEITDIFTSDIQLRGLDKRNLNSEMPLHIAIRKKNKKIVERLLEYGADISTVLLNDNEGLVHEITTLVALFTRNELDFETISLLLKSGADVNAVDHEGNTPLHLLVTAHDSGKEPYWIESPSDIRTQKFLELLCSYNTDVNLKNNTGSTPIAILIKNENSKFSHFSYLIEKSYVPNIADNEGNTALHVIAARKHGKLKMLELILEFNIDVNIKNNKGFTPLMILCRSCETDLAPFTLLLEHGADVNIVDIEGNTPLHAIASREGDGFNEILKLLLKYKAKVNVKNVEGSTPLSLLCENLESNPESLALLVMKGADVNAVDERGKTPLHSLAEMGRRKREMFELFMRYSPNVNIRDTNGATPLFLLCGTFFCDLSLFNLLFEAGADLDVVDDEVNTLLHLIAGLPRDCGKQDMLKRILSTEKLDVNVTNKRGLTPLLTLCEHNETDIGPFFVLLEAGADANVTDNNGNTPLHLIAAYEDCKKKGDLFKLLLVYDSNVNDKNNEGLTPLLELCKSGEKEYEPFFNLIAAGADVNVVDNDGNTPLQLVASTGRGEQQEEILRTLCMHKAEVNVTNKRGYTPLMDMCKKSRMDFAPFSVLVEAGADVNIVDDRGNTPLHIVAGIRREYQKTNILNMLTKYKTDINVKNYDGLTPLIVLCRSGERNATSYSHFLKAGADVDAVDDEGNSPLHFIAGLPEEYKKEELLKLFLSYKPKINVRNKEGSTPFIVLCKSQDKVLECFSALVDAGADVNLADNQGFTPLHYAGGCNSQLCYLLISNNANINAKSKTGTTPLTENYQYFRVVEKLLENGADMSEIYFPGPSLPYRRALCEIVTKFIFLRKSQDPSWYPPWATDFLQHFQNEYPNIFNNFSKKIEREIERLKAAKIGYSKKTLWDIVTSNMDQNTKYLRDHNVKSQIDVTVGQFGCSDFTKCLNRKLFQAHTRRNLLDKCIEYLPSIMNTTLPYICLENIVEHLGEQSLKNILRAYRSISNNDSSFVRSN